MKKWIALPLAALLTLAGVYVATADYTIKDGGGSSQTILAFVCSTTKICPGHVIINSSGTELATSSNPVRTDPTGTTTQPMSAASLPLPTGASTAAKQPALGTAGTASADVLSVQGVASMTALKVDGSGVTQPVSGTVSVNTHAVTESGTWTVQPGNTANTTAWLVVPSSQYPSGATAITASATGTTAATTATLAGTTGKTTYVCSLSIRSNATAAATGNATVTGTITGTMNYTHWTAPLASGVGVTEQVFAPCVPASATNTGIAVVSPAPGSGGVVSVSATGYQL